MASTTCGTWINTSETQLHKITEQTTWFKKVIPSVGSLTYLILIGLGLEEYDSEVHSKHLELCCL